MALDIWSKFNLKLSFIKGLKKRTYHFYNRKGIMHPKPKITKSLNKNEIVQEYYVLQKIDDEFELT